MTATPDPAMTKPVPIAFSFVEQAGSFFFELGVRFGDRWDAIGGSRALACPEDALMRAATVLLSGAWRAEAPFPAENDDFTLAFRVFGGWEAPSVKIFAERPVELAWIQLAPETETRMLGVAQSILQLAEASLEAGEAYYAGRPASVALVALRAVLPAVRDAAPLY